MVKSSLKDSAEDRDMDPEGRGRGERENARAAPEKGDLRPGVGGTHVSLKLFLVFL